MRSSRTWGPMQFRKRRDIKVPVGELDVVAKNGIIGSLWGTEKRRIIVEKMRFQYTALDRKGDEIAGEIDAADDVEALAELRKTGIYPIRLSEQENDSRGNPGVAAEEKSQSPQDNDNGKKGCSSLDDPKHSEEFTVVATEEVDNHALPEASLIDDAYDNPSQ